MSQNPGPPEFGLRGATLVKDRGHRQESGARAGPNTGDSYSASYGGQSQGPRAGENQVLAFKTKKNTFGEPLASASAIRHTLFWATSRAKCAKERS